MADIDINEVQKNIEELQDQNAIDFQQWKKLRQDIEELTGNIKTNDNRLRLVMEKIKSDYENLKKVIIDENIQFELTDSITKINEQLNNKANKVNNIIYLEDVKGFKGDGITDDSEVIQNSLNELSLIGGGKLIFPYMKTVKVSQQGEKALQTWHNGKYPIRYSLTIGDNIEIDLNYSTIFCNTLSEKGNAPICIFLNKNSSNDDVGNKNITLKNGTLDSKINFSNLSSVVPSNMGNYDFVTLLFNNIENLTLDNVTINNAYGYALYNCNFKNTIIKNRLKINNIIGCGARFGWYDNSKNINIDEFICSNCINIYDETFNVLNSVPSNQIYVVAENATINKLTFDFTEPFIPTDEDILNSRVSSSNFANTCNNITINESYCYYSGHKFQDYSKVVPPTSIEYEKPKPDNINLGKVYMYKSAIRIQSNKCYINELIGEDLQYILINGNYTNINKINIDGCGLTEIKGEVEEVHIIDATFKNCQRVISYSDCTAKIIEFNKLTFIRDDDNKFIGITGANINYLGDFQTLTNIDKLIIINDPSQNCKSDLVVNKFNGSVIGSVIGTNKLGKKFTDNFTVTLTSGTTDTSVNLGTIAEGYVFKEFTEIGYSLDVIPLNNSAYNLDIYTSNITNYGYWFKMRHSEAVGGEKFLIKINKIIRTESPNWQ